VFDLLPPALQHLHAVGRLDMHTSGLLLLTNDTRLSSHLTAPANAIPREYAVSVDGKVSDATLARAVEGVMDDGERLAASGVRVRTLPLSKQGFRWA
jgi:pseudouridine synthase